MRRPGSSRFSLKTAVAIIFILASAAGTYASSQTAPPSISKVEPPSWWAGHSINPVRLLVRGRNLSGARVKASAPQVLASDVRINRQGTYLFVSVNVNRTARPGDYPLLLVTTAGSATIPFHIDEPLNPGTHFQGITTADVIYLIMPDRFSDGDQMNNAPADSPSVANDRRNPRAYHGGDFRGIINHLSYFKELRVTT